MNQITDQEFAQAFPELARIRAKARASADLTEKLTLMKEYTNKAKIQMAQGQGQLQQLEQQRATEFGCPTDAEAEMYIKELEQDITRLETDLKSGVELVTEELGW